MTVRKLPELDTNLSPFGLHRLRFASSRKVEIHWSMRAVTMINLRFVSGSGDRDRCEFCNLLPAGGCIGRCSFVSVRTRIGEHDLCRKLARTPPRAGSLPLRAAVKMPAVGNGR
jgi:hypothetical protein